jgi:hypothetical protein
VAPAQQPAARRREGGGRLESGGIRASVWLIAAAMLVGASMLLVLGRLVFGEPPDTPAPAARIVVAAPAAVAAAARPKLRAVPREAAAMGAAEPVPEPQAPEGPAFELAPPGSPPTGIALFPPPGTDPPKRGIIVPEDAVLPEGYVRHYQAMDDGKELPAILMFHPDYEWVDEQGALVPLPESRVVPPDMAPPGLPLEMLELPAAEPEGGARP